MRRASILLLAFVAIVLAGCSQSPATPSQSVAAAGGGSTLVRHDQSVPFWGAVEGQADFSTSACAQGFTALITAEGNFTHMGLTTWKSHHCIFQGMITAGELTLTAANGDTLRATYTGSCVVGTPVGQTVNCSGTAILLAGTGRFVKATGTAKFVAAVLNKGMTEPIWPGRWELTDGTILY